MVQWRGRVYGEDDPTGRIRNNSWRYVRTAQTACFKSHEGDLPRSNCGAALLFRPLTINRARKTRYWSPCFNLGSQVWHLLIFESVSGLFRFASFLAARSVCVFCAIRGRTSWKPFAEKMGGWAIFLFFHTLNAVFWEPLKSHSISIGACSFRKLRVEQWSASSNKGSNVDRNNDKMSNNLMPIQKLPLVSRTKWDLTRHCLKILET